MQHTRLALILLAIGLLLPGCRAATPPPATALPTAAASAAPIAAATVARPSAPPPSAVTSPPSPMATPAPVATSSVTQTTGAAFGTPGVSDFWTAGSKVGVGTAYTYDEAAKGRPAASRVWFALTGGAITELSYPTVDLANVRELSLLVARPAAGGSAVRVQRETDLAAPITPTVEYLDPQALAYRVTTRDPDGAWQAVKEVVTDPAADSLVTRWRFTATDPAAGAYAWFVPHLGGAGRNDNLAVRDGAVVAWDESRNIYAVLLMDPPPARASVGYLKTSDGLVDLRQDGKLDWSFDHLPQPGYGAATLALPADRSVTLVVGFGATEAEARAAAQASLARGFDAVARAYIAGWRGYLARLAAPPQADPLYWVSAMVLKAHEDKSHPGAVIASLAAPWGQCLSDYKSEQGYRYVWPRDLYHAAQAYLALGDRDSARRVLDYMANGLQRPDGSFPQNLSVDGSPRWNAIQMDETADPILLAAALGAQELYAGLVKPAANFIAASGPTTQQERWEENGGYSPATLAAEIAGLIAAAGMADKANDTRAAAAWRATADDWAARLDGWTLTTKGPYAPGRYYLRLSGSDGPDNPAATLSLTNGSGPHPAQAVVDVSTLELVRLGLRSPMAPAIVDSLAVIDAQLRDQTPAGPAWRRYSFDRYGESVPGRCAPGAGHPWPLFNGERGLYAVAAGRLEDAKAQLAEMRAFANAGLLLPEQVYADGHGTGSATPLVWAHAEYIVLARSIQEGRVLDRPAGVAERYAR